MKMHNLWKRTISGFLAFLMVFTLVPPAAFASEPAMQAYGDVNGDGRIDVRDVLVMQKHLLGENPENFSAKHADVNGDQAVDLKDLLVIKKYLVGWDVQMGPAHLTVSFYDGDRLIDQLQALPGEPLGQTPSNAKTSRSDGIL